MLVAAVGGLLAIAGTFIKNCFQMRTTLRTRMNQVIAERKVLADADALECLKMIEGHLAEHTEAGALALMVSREDWLSANRLFLPRGFAEVWTALQTTLRWLSESPTDTDRNVDDVRRLRLNALRYVKQAAQEIYSDMDFKNGSPDFTAPA